jgi:hypothetical protein
MLAQRNGQEVGSRVLLPALEKPRTGHGAPSFRTLQEPALSEVEGAAGDAVDAMKRFGASLEACPYFQPAKNAGSTHPAQTPSQEAGKKVAPRFREATTKEAMWVGATQAVK